MHQADIILRLKKKKANLNKLLLLLLSIFSVPQFMTEDRRERLFWEQCFQDPKNKIKSALPYSQLLKPQKALAVFAQSHNCGGISTTPQDWHFLFFSWKLQHVWVARQTWACFNGPWDWTCEMRYTKPKASWTCDLWMGLHILPRKMNGNHSFARETASAGNVV